MDLQTFFFPWYAFLGERLRAFAVPGWNPHLFSGAPFAGDPESGWMYVPAMLAFTLFISAVTAFKAMVVVQLAVAALSAYALARVLGMGPFPSLIAATVYLTGPFLHWNTHCCLIFSQFATWIPLALLGVELALRATTWRQRITPWLAAGLAVSQMLGGWIGEGWLYAMLLPAAYIGYRALLSPPRSAIPFRERVALTASSGVAVLGSGLALAAAGVWPRLAVNAETNLAGGDYSRLAEGGVLNPPWSLDYLLQQTLGSGSGYHFRAAAIGGTAVVLSLLALPLARQRFAVPFFLLLTLVAMLLTLDTTPLHQLFYLIPRYREFHDHDAWRTIALTAIGPAILSGAAVSCLPRWRGRPRLLPLVSAPLIFLFVVELHLRQSGASLGWVPLLAATLATVVVGLWVGLPVREGRSSPREALTPSPSPIAMGEGHTPEGVASGNSFRRQHTRSRARERAGVRANPGEAAFPFITALLLLILLFPTGIELLGSWLGLPREETPWQHLDRNPALDLTLAIEESSADAYGGGEFLRQRLAVDGPFRYAGYSGFGYPPDAPSQSYMERRLDPFVQAILANGRPIFLGLYDIQGYNPLQLSRYVEFMNALNGSTQDYHTAFLLPSAANSPLLDLLDVRYLLIDASLPPDREDVAALTAGAREVYRSPWAVVYERAAHPAHAWIVHDVRAARGEALLLLASGAVDPYQTALVEGTPPETGQPTAAGQDAARITAYEPDRVSIATRSSADGFLVVSEIYADGWRAFVDGQETPILPTDHALRGVALPAGEHTVEMRYEPLSLRVGLAISGITAIAMLAAFAVNGWSALVRRPRSQSTLHVNIASNAHAE